MTAKRAVLLRMAMGFAEADAAFSRTVIPSSSASQTPRRGALASAADVADAAMHEGSGLLRSRRALRALVSRLGL